MGAFWKALELLNLRTIKSSLLNKNAPLNSHSKYLTHTLKDSIFKQCWNCKSSQIKHLIWVFETPLLVFTYWDLLLFPFYWHGKAAILSGGMLFIYQFQVWSRDLIRHAVQPMLLIFFRFSFTAAHWLYMVWNMLTVKPLMYVIPNPKT